MRTTNIIMLASQSTDKFHEFHSLFKNYPEYELKALNELVFNPSSLKEVETGKTYYENAFAKGRLAHLAAKYPTISDDSGLEVQILDGKPGIHSARYETPRPGEQKDAANLRKLLSDLKGVPPQERTAQFTCTLVFFVEGIVLTATESLEGTILETPRGSNGFGYDPIFLPKGLEKTLAEISLEEKNKISHRYKALKSLMQQIRDKGIKLARP